MVFYFVSIALDMKDIFTDLPSVANSKIESTIECLKEFS